MKIYDLDDFRGGWFVGNFMPTLFPIEETEVAIKRYKAGDFESKHMHKLSDEITVIVSGKVSMNGEVYKENDVILIDKGEATDFIAITDAVTCVVKIPSSKDDKYPVV